MGHGGPVNPSAAMGGPSMATGPMIARSFIQLNDDPTSTSPLQPPSNDLVVQQRSLVTGNLCRNGLDRWSF